MRQLAATDRSLRRMEITGMKGAEAGTAEAPFMEVIFLLWLRSEPAAAAGNFFYMSPKPVPV